MTDSTRQGPGAAAFLPDHIDGLIVDLDGVITRAGALYAAAWKRMLDAVLEREARGTAIKPFDAMVEYRAHIDGRPRLDGMRSFLAARGLRLEEGRAGDPADAYTVHGLLKRKDAYFDDALAEEGVEVFPASVEFLDAARDAGLKLAVLASGGSAQEILKASGIDVPIDVIIGAPDREHLGLQGKPVPDFFLEAARRLTIAPERIGVIEDDEAGIRAGRAAGFGFVIGVDRVAKPEVLSKAGADLVVSDLSELLRGGGPPLALRAKTMLAQGIKGRQVALFLDYDGTVTPIVDRPEEAVLSEPMRKVIADLSWRVPVAFISGRAKEEVRAMVGLDGVTYAGSHGFDIDGPDGVSFVQPDGARLQPVIRDAASQLQASIGHIGGVLIEDKRFAVAVHYRLVAERDFSAVRDAVEAMGADHPDLRVTGGKKVFELRPRIDWHKGRALTYLLESLGLARSETLAFYLGDDVTDQDAFEALGDRGVGILVNPSPAPTAAHFRLRDPDEVLAFLQWLAGVLPDQGRERS